MGPDNLHPRILKEAADALAPALTILFIKCIEDRQIPSVWWEATITPIYKKGGLHSSSGCRPISLTSIPYKIFEKVIEETMLYHLQSNKLMSRSQHGFLPGRPCITYMLTLMDSLTQAYDDSQLWGSLHRLFQSIWQGPHAPLLHKLKVSGFEGKLLPSLKNFLSECSFSVKVSSAYSSSSPDSSGVLQGSVLGPLLFLIYNNVLSQILLVPTLTYVNDVTIWSTSPPQLQASIDAAKRWSPNWGLYINDDKCAHVPIGASSCTFNILSVQRPQRLHNIRSWGFCIFDNLSLSCHRQKANKAAFCVLKVLHRSFPIIGKKDFPFLFSTYIRPILKYGSQIAHTGLMRDRDCLERVRRLGTKLIKDVTKLIMCTYNPAFTFISACSKLIKDLSNLPYSARLIELNLYPLEFRRIHGDLMLLFHLFQTGNLHDFFPLTAQKHLRGHDKRLILPHCQICIRHNFFTLREICPWNALPEEILYSSSKTTSKWLLDSYLGLQT